MKRILLSALLLVILFAGCSSSEQPADERISVVCTVFPHYDWVREIIGQDDLSRFDLTLLLDTGVDLHSYNATVQDIAKIKTGDVFIYVGGHSDSWVPNALQDANPDLVTVNLMEILELGDLVIEGVPCGLDCTEDHDHVNEFFADEHVWLSLKNAQLVCAAISDILAQVDPEHAETYNANMNAYTAKLAALDDEYRAAVDSADRTTLVIADRFPFRYLINDYGLRHFAAFAGCTAESEASFNTVISLAMQVDRLGLNAVVVTETSDQTIARTVIENTADKDHKILVLDAIQSVTANDVRDGATYLSIMESNLSVLKEALT